jgi:hypothetical protein
LRAVRGFDLSFSEDVETNLGLLASDQLAASIE